MHPYRKSESLSNFHSPLNFGYSFFSAGIPAMMPWMVSWRYLLNSGLSGTMVRSRRLPIKFIWAGRSGRSGIKYEVFVGSFPVLLGLKGVLVSFKMFYEVESPPKGFEIVYSAKVESGGRRKGLLFVVCNVGTQLIRCRFIAVKTFSSFQGLCAAGLLAFQRYSRG